MVNGSPEVPPLKDCRAGSSNCRVADDVEVEVEDEAEEAEEEEGS